MRKMGEYVKVLVAFVAHEFLLTHSFELPGQPCGFFCAKVDPNKVRIAFRES